MDIEILTYSKVLKPTLAGMSKFYAKKLKLTKSKYKLFIVTDKNLRKQGSNGLCAKTGQREITISLYSRLSASEMMMTLAHEMVHVKQFARGQYKNVPMKYGKGVYHYWMGEKVNKEYLSRPWEIEAYTRQEHLYDQLLSHLTRKINKVLKQA
jgi:hypothetical protein